MPNQTAMVKVDHRNSLSCVPRTTEAGKKDGRTKMALVSLYDKKRRFMSSSNDRPLSPLKGNKRDRDIGERLRKYGGAEVRLVRHPKLMG